MVTVPHSLGISNQPNGALGERERTAVNPRSFSRLPPALTQGCLHMLFAGWEVAGEMIHGRGG
jgi:hypothetical protein